MAQHVLDRRAFLKFSALATLGPGVAPLVGLESDVTPGSKADYTLRIGRAHVALAPGHIVSTTAYNGQIPGPLLRLSVGRPVVVDIYNDTETAEQVQWHAQDTSRDFTTLPGDDAMLVSARGMRRVTFTPRRSGLYFYHSHRIAAANLEAGLYNAQIGPVLIAPRNEPGRFDREVVLVLKEFEPLMRRTAQGCELDYRLFTINGRMLGHGEPVRVNAGERVLFHVLNASATELRNLALSGHSFRVVALDGAPVPSPAIVPVLRIGAAETVAALVEMTRPGVWILGDLAAEDRRRGMGIVVEYAGRAGKPEWREPAAACWDYTRFGRALPRAPAVPLEMVFVRNNAARSGFNRWTINGAAFSTRQTNPLFRVRRGRRYRLRMTNTSDACLPVHLQRHRFELTAIAGRPTAGILKDVVLIGARQQVEVDFVADSPGPALFHCKQQLQMDFGLMALIDYV